MIGRMNHRDYKAATARLGLTKPKKRQARKQQRRMPRWSAPVGGKLQRFDAWTKSEVRALAKAARGGEPLPVGYGLMIVRVD